MKIKKRAIAIIGMSCRVPGANNYNQLWENLKNGIESISFFSKEELINSGIDPNLVNNPKYVRARGIIGDAECFDANFFGFSPREALFLDPQYRLFLECAWEALEDAGYKPKDDQYKIGIFGGSGSPWHFIHLLKTKYYDTNGVLIATSNDKDYLTTKVSYALGLEGPSINIQTACSTALVSVIRGSYCLLNEECDMVLAGGCSVVVPEKIGYLYQEGSLDSADGHCRAFDAQASGTVFSNGVGIVVLKRLSDALRDGDHIHGIIRGMAVNNDGNKKVGFSAPSIHGQSSVEQAALEFAKINPETISYVEAHGTATQLGDPIEMEALINAFEKYTDKKQFCAIGSIKTNIGHTDIAAGVVSLIKTLLCMKHGMLPKTLHFNSPNNNISFTNSPFFVNTSLIKWIENDPNTPLRAMVNSFGVGGTNASVVIEKLNNNHLDAETDLPKIFILSAKQDIILDVMAGNLKQFLDDNNSIPLDNIAYTLQTGRNTFEYRLFFLAKNHTEALQSLKERRKYTFSIFSKNLNAPVIYMFPGQGTQYVGMGKKLYSENKFFKENLDYCTNYLEAEFGIDIIDTMFSNDENVSIIENPVIAQASLFSIEYALAKLFSTYIEPTLMIGHSLGEYTAACLAGVFSCEDALKIVVTRAKLIERLSARGTMLAILASEMEVRRLISEKNLDIAVVNSPDIVVVSGNISNIDAFKLKLNSLHIAYKLVSTTHAFHSRMVDDVVEPLKFVLENNIKLCKPQKPFVSTVTGTFITEAECLDPNYWATHLRKTVVFSKALTQILTQYGDSSVFLELGPGNTLESAVKKHKVKNMVVGTLKKVQSNTETIYHALGMLWASGTSIKWINLYKDINRKKIPLPTYPFEKTKFTLDVQNEQIDTNKEHKSNNYFYLPCWVRSVPIDINLAFAKEYCWVIFTKDHILDNSIYKQLMKHGKMAILVHQANNFSYNHEAFHINATNPNHYKELFIQIARIQPAPLAIINLWNFEKKIELNFQTIDKLIDEKFFSLVFMQQALLDLDLLSNLKLVCVVNNAFDIVGDGKIHPSHALLVGPCKVFSRENLSVHTKILDIQDLTQDEATVAEQIITETIAYLSDEVVCYKNGHRWLQTFEQTNSVPENNKVIKEKGVYVITGGLGDIGLEVARYLCKEYNAKVVLIYKSALPNRAVWDKMMTDYSTDHILKKKIGALIALEDSGADFMLYKTDVCNYTSMKEMAKIALEKYGQIDGVFHAAGLPGDGIIPLKRVEQAKKVLAPKVKGTLVLDEIFNKVDLDIFVLFSSITSFLGESGQVDYCSANAFINAFAHHKKSIKTKTKTLSINWGLWNDIGMAVKYAGGAYENKNLDSSYPAKQQNSREELYQITFKSTEDWIIHEHKLFEIPTMVGTAYIHIMNKILKDRFAGKPVILDNVAFLKPFFFKNYVTKTLSIFIRDSSKFVLTEQHSNLNNLPKKEQELLIGKINLAESHFQTHTEISALKSRMIAIKNFDNSLKAYADHTLMLAFSNRWNVKRKIYEGVNEWLAYLTLPEVYIDDLKEFNLHPAMLDVATAFCLSYISNDAFLPLAYKKIIILDSLKPKVYSYIKLNNNNDSTIALSIVITDEAGKNLIVIEDYTLKRVTKNSIDLFNTEILTKEKELPKNSINARDGIIALNKTLSLNLPEVVIFPGNLKQVILETISKDEGLKVKQKVLYERTNLSVAYAPPTNELEEAICIIWESVLGIDKIGIEDNFIELGGNSLIAIQIVSQINALAEFEYTVNKFYMDLTVANIAKGIMTSIEQDAAKYNIEFI